MKTRVFKFGGSSFPTLESYLHIAGYVKKRLETDTARAVVVVSAMSGTTGRLLEAGLKINPEISSEVTDSLLGTGEMVAAALMRTAFDHIGVTASHLTGYQLGLQTDSRFTRAKMRAFDRATLESRLQSGEVVIVAGGQATDVLGRLTMLGRNSSDLSAVLIAAALKISECEIFSDVPGVYTADPYEVPAARVVRDVPYDSIIALSRAGAKVLHYGAVEAARDNEVVILCRSSGEDDSIGSVIGRGSPLPMVASNKNVVIMEFADSAGRDQAVARLEGAGMVVDSVSLPGGQAGLAMWKDNRAWCELISAFDLKKHMSSDSWVIVTEVGLGNRISKTVIPQEKAADLVRALHSKHYPPEGQAIPRISKSRSSYSNVLV